MKEYKSVKVFLKENSNFEGRQFEITVDGDMIKSLLNKGCVYEQKGIVFYDDRYKDKITTYGSSTGFHDTTEPIYLILNSTDGNSASDTYKIKVDINNHLRLFIQPEVITSFTKETTPKNLKHQFEYGVVIGRNLKFCLKKEKKYYLIFETYDYAYGRPYPDGHRSHSSLIFVKISDKPFRNSKPQVPESPMYFGVIYS